MKRKNVVTFVIIIGALQAAHSQSRISGQLIDNKNEPLPYANVLLLNASDSSLVKGSITNQDGNFALEGIKSGNFFIVATMVGYKKMTLPAFTFSGEQNIKLNELTLEEEATQLNEVVIKADKPVFEQRIDGLVVNVANSISSVGGTALQVLERSPGITVNRQSNVLSMSGKQGVLVMFNGKVQRIPMSALVQLLNTMPASSIEKIELITNPAAKYDAQGDGGIINIVSKKNPEYGTTGSVTGSLGYSYYGKSSGSINLSHRSKKFAIFGDFSGTYSKLWQQFNLDRSIVNPDQQTTTTATRYVLTPVYNGRIGAEWSLGKKTSINALISGFTNIWEMNSYNTSQTRQRGVDSVNVDLLDHEINHWKNLMGNININHVFKEGSSLNIDADYLYYHDNNPHNFVNNYYFLQTSSSSLEKINISKQTPINMGVLKIDYEKMFKKIKIETGVKTTFSRLTNNVLVEKNLLNEWVPDPKFTQSYSMKDDVLAAYISSNIKLNAKDQLQIGLRTEHTDMQIETASAGKIFDLNFWSLFPTAFYSRQLNTNHSIQFSYGRRITRPTYQDIAPFVIFMDPFTYFSGNPKLKPTITENVQASYSFKELLVSLKYSFDKDFIAKFQTRVDPIDKKTYWYSVNLDQVQTYSLSLSFPISVTKWWEIQNNYMGLYQQINTLYQDVPVNIVQTSGQFNMTQTFTLPNNFTFELSGMYWTPSRFGIALFKDYGSVSAGLQKKLKNGSFSVNINDIFWTNVWRIQTLNAELNQNQNGSFKFAEPRVVTVSYTYNFGRNTIKSSKARSTASEVEQGRVK